MGFCVMRLVVQCGYVKVCQCVVQWGVESALRCVFRVCEVHSNVLWCGMLYRGFVWHGVVQCGMF